MQQFCEKIASLLFIRAIASGASIAPQASSSQLNFTLHLKIINYTLEQAETNFILNKCKC